MVKRKNREGDTRGDRQTYTAGKRVKIERTTKESISKYEQEKKLTKSPSF
jgi:hypothetical protein